MEDTAQKGISKPEGASSVDGRPFTDILKSLVGKNITVVNPESYEGAPVGYRLKTGFYTAKAVGVGTDFMVLVTEFTRSGSKAGTEPAKQYLPISQIKRLSITKSERILHI